MIDPHHITNFNRRDNDLQEFLLFCIVVAGKSSQQQAQKLNAFLEDVDFLHLSPLERIRRWNHELTYRLRQVKMGQYRRISKAFRAVSKLYEPGLRIISVDRLEKIDGIGPKTARFFILHSQPNQRVAVLDTHILKWLKARLTHITVPKTTPSGAKYLELEKAFLDYADSMNMTPANLDLLIWSNAAK